MASTKKEEKKQEILTQAMKIFSRNGVKNTTMEEIAEGAGIGKGTIYEYFRSKEDIFAEAFGRYMEHLDESIAKRLYRVYDPIEKVKAVLSGFVEMMKDTHVDFIAIMVEFWAEGVQSKQRAPAFDLKKAYEDNRVMLASILQEGITAGSIRPMNASLTASLILGSIDGLMLQWFIDPNVFDLNALTDDLIDSFVQMLKPA